MREQQTEDTTPCSEWVLNIWSDVINLMLADYLFYYCIFACICKKKISAVLQKCISNGALKKKGVYICLSVKLKSSVHFHVNMLLCSHDGQVHFGTGTDVVCVSKFLLLSRIRVRSMGFKCVKLLFCIVCVVQSAVEESSTKKKNGKKGNK